MVEKNIREEYETQKEWFQDGLEPNDVEQTKKYNEEQEI